MRQNIRKSEKIWKNLKKMFFVISIFIYLFFFTKKRLVFDQSSPVQSVSESRQTKVIQKKNCKKKLNLKKSKKFKKKKRYKKNTKNPTKKNLNP